MRSDSGFGTASGREVGLGVVNCADTGWAETGWFETGVVETKLVETAGFLDAATGKGIFPKFFLASRE